MTWRPAPPATPGRDVVRGRAAIIPVVGGVVSTAPEVLVDLQVPEPTTWGITLLPITSNARARQYPAASVAASSFVQGVTSVNWTLTYGAGSTTFETFGVWPATGRTWTVQADTLRLSAVAGGASTDSAIVISAWATPSTGPITFWTEINTELNLLNRTWPVPIGAKTLWGWRSNTVTLQWVDINANPVGVPLAMPNAAPVQVPSTARSVQLTGALVNVSWMWEIQL